MIGGLTARHTIARERPTMVSDGRGGEHPDFTGVTPVELAGWALDAGNTISDRENRYGASVEWTARGPFGADVERHDRITVFGDRFQIEGAVRRQPGPTATTSHTILLLKRWEG